MKKPAIFLLLILTAFISASAGTWTPPAASEWVNINAGGYVAVDRTIGKLFVARLGQQLLESVNQGATYTPIPGAAGVSTGIPSGWRSFYVSPDGGKIAVFGMYGGGGFSLNSGVSWKPYNDYNAKGLEQGVMDWEKYTGMTLALMHNDISVRLIFSGDSGKNFSYNEWSISQTPCDSGFEAWAGLGATRWKKTGKLFPMYVAVRCNGDVYHSYDYNQTWVKGNTLNTRGPVWYFKHKPYWLTKDGVLTLSIDSTALVDSGKTWTYVGAPFTGHGEAQGGPYFGVDENHMIIATSTHEFIETRDGGQTWYALAPFPVGFEQNISIGHGYSTSFGYDPTRDILYVSGMNVWPDTSTKSAKLVLARPDVIAVNIEQKSLNLANVQMSSFPNPFTRSTQISVSIPADAGNTAYSLKVYNLCGQLVRTLVSGEAGNSGAALTRGWNGKDEQGRSVRSGVYCYRLTIGDRSLTGNLVLAK